VPLVLDPSSLGADRLQALVRELREALAETRELVEHPRGAVRDPASLECARELLDAALARTRPDASDPVELAASANLAYAAMLAAIDLVKSHTDVPRVPRARGAGPRPSA
jgi:hypothetical protein